MASRASPRNHQDSTVYEEKVTQKGEHYFHPYHVGRLLGRGGFATCYEVNAANDNTKYAIKIIPKDEDPQKRLEAIAKVLLADLDSGGGGHLKVAEPPWHRQVLQRLPGQA
jgi:serine/threonine protein kinase